MERTGEKTSRIDVDYATYMSVLEDLLPGYRALLKWECVECSIPCTMCNRSTPAGCSEYGPWILPFVDIRTSVGRVRIARLAR